MNEAIEQATTEADRATGEAMRAQESYDAYLEADGDDVGEHVVDWSIACDDARDAAAATLASAIIEADEPRAWKVKDGQGTTGDLGTLNLADAADAARDWISEGEFGDIESTIWFDALVYCEATGEEMTITSTIDPLAPRCSDGDRSHDWQRPHEIVGGCESNPGVWGNGGGVIITEVCMSCGCERKTNTWATRPDTGRQGLESVRYEAGKYADEVAALAAEVEAAQ